MKNKKLVYGIIGVFVLVFAGIALYFGTKVLPKMNAVNEIIGALQPMIEAQNQSMDLEIDAKVKDEAIQLDSKLYMLTEDDRKYLVMEQESFPIYIVDNMLLFENGKAFLLADEIESQTDELDYDKLFSLLMVLYEELDMTFVKTDLETSYSVMVTGEKMQEVLDILVPAEELLAIENLDLSQNMQQLQVCVVLQEGKLQRIEFAGEGNIMDTTSSISLHLSNFKLLESGAYPIPPAVIETVQTADKSTLFNLTEDVYRLAVALEPFSDIETIDGTVQVEVNCGLLQFDTTLDFQEMMKMTQEDADGNIGSEGADGEDAQMNTTALQNIPQMMGYLCMESEIRSVETQEGNIYTLVLEESAMQEICEMVIPELLNYVIDFKEGNVELLLTGDRISTMKITIDGSIRVLFSDIPAEVNIVFQF